MTRDELIQFQCELERTPEALAAWRRYHKENAA